MPGYRRGGGRRAELRDRDVRRRAPVARQLALGRHAVLPAHRQAPAEARDRDRDPVQARPAPSVLLRRGRAARAERAGAAHPARRGHLAALRREGARDAHPDPHRQHGLRLRHRVLVADRRGVRDAAARRDARRPDELHARRTRCESRGGSSSRCSRPGSGRAARRTCTPPARGARTPPTICSPATGGAGGDRERHALDDRGDARRPPRARDVRQRARRAHEHARPRRLLRPTRAGRPDRRGGCVAAVQPPLARDHRARPATTRATSWPTRASSARRSAATATACRSAPRSCRSRAAAAGSRCRAWSPALLLPDLPVFLLWRAEPDASRVVLVAPLGARDPRRRRLDGRGAGARARSRPSSSGSPPARSPISRGRRSRAGARPSRAPSTTPRTRPRSRS